MNELKLSKIEGYLTSLATIDTDLGDGLGYGYLFYEIPSNGDMTKSIKEHIFNHLNETKVLERKSKEISEKYTDLYNSLEFNIIPSWKSKVIESFKNSPFVLLKQNLKKGYSGLENDYVLKELLVLIDGLFENKSFEVWEFGEKIKEELHLFWGDLWYRDFIFTCNNKYFILHFGMYD